MVKSEWLGLWWVRQAFYRSKPITQAQIKAMPKKTRIVLRYNKFYGNSESGRPKFVFCFADAEGADAIEFGTKEPDDLSSKIKDIRNSAIYGQECCGNYDDAWHYLCRIEDKCDELLRNIEEVEDDD